jgi:F0F1-type ATP synthase assembly protein I
VKSFEEAAFRGARLPSVVALVVATLSFWLAKGGKGALGALVGGCIALTFFAIHLLVSHLTKRADPAYVMALAFASYFAKVLALLLFLVTFAGTKAFDSTAFAVTTLAVSVAWLTGEIFAYIRRG